MRKWRALVAMAGFSLMAGNLQADPNCLGNCTGIAPVNLYISSSPSGVTAGAYTNANITVDVNGRVTAAANGTAGAAQGSAGDSIASSTMARIQGATSGNIQTAISFQARGSTVGMVAADGKWAIGAAVSSATSLLDIQGGSITVRGTNSGIRVFGGTVTATEFNGSGDQITGLLPGNIVAGSLGSSVIADSVSVRSLNAVYAASGSFTGSNKLMSNTSFYGPVQISSSVKMYTLAPDDQWILESSDISNPGNMRLGSNSGTQGGFFHFSTSLGIDRLKFGYADSGNPGLAFTTLAGSNKLFLASNGNVGINTSNPSALIHVSSPSGTAGYFLRVSSGSTNLFEVNGTSVVVGVQLYDRQGNLYSTSTVGGGGGGGGGGSGVNFDLFIATLPTNAVRVGSMTAVGTITSTSGFIVGGSTVNGTLTVASPTGGAGVLSSPSNQLNFDPANTGTPVIQVNASSTVVNGTIFIAPSSDTYNLLGQIVQTRSAGDIISTPSLSNFGNVVMTNTASTGTAQFITRVAWGKSDPNTDPSSVFAAMISTGRNPNPMAFSVAIATFSAGLAAAQPSFDDLVWTSTINVVTSTFSATNSTYHQNTTPQPFTNWKNVIGTGNKDVYFLFTNINGLAQDCQRWINSLLVEKRRT